MVVDDESIDKASSFGFFINGLDYLIYANSY